MSGIIQLLNGGGALASAVITVGQSTAFTTRVGWGNDTGGMGFFGTMVPNGISIRGRFVEAIVCDSLNTFADFYVQISGTGMVQSHFQLVRVLDYNNVWRTFETANATAFGAGSDTSWRWGNGGASGTTVWRTSTDNGLTGRRIEFY